MADQSLESNLPVDPSAYEVLVSVNRLFSRSTDLPEGELFCNLVELLADQLDLAIASIAVRSAGSDRFDFPFVAGSSKEFLSDLRESERDGLSRDQDPISLAMRTEDIVAIDVDENGFSRWSESATEREPGGGLAVPFRFPDESVGVLCLCSRQESPFRESFRPLAVELRDDLSDFLRRRREHEQLSRLSDYQDAVGLLLHQLLAVPDPITAYGEVTRILIEKTDALAAWVSVPQGGFLKTVAGECKGAIQDLQADLWKFRPRLRVDGSPASRSVAATAFRSGKPVLASDGSSPHLEGMKTVYPSLSFVRVAGAWPIVISGKPTAVLVMVSDDTEYFSAALTGLLDQLADGLRIAVQNFETQAEARRISRVYQALLTEGDLLFSVGTEQEFLTQACSRILESGLFRTVWVGIQVDGENLKALVSTGENNSELDLLVGKVGESGWAETSSMKAIVTGETVVVRDYVHSPVNSRWAQIADRNGWRSSVSVPIERHGGSWGVLSVISDRLDGFSEDMIELISRISQMISHGLREIDLREELNSERDKQSWLASHDPLTGLPNRRGLEDHIAEAISRAKRHGTLLVVGMLDLDDFKIINDTYGHDLGDQALRNLTKTLRDSLRQTDLLARVGGDEFVLVLEDVRRFPDLIKILQKFENVLYAPLILPDGNRVTVGGSLGLSVYSGNSATPNELLHSADQALYLLKRRKGYRSRAWAFHSPDDPEGISPYPYFTRSSQKADETSDFQYLIRSGGLHVLYQPIVKLSTGEVVGLEALARLVSTNGVVYLPEQFLSELTLEDQKLLTLKVLSTVERDLAEIKQDGFNLWCSINVLADLIMSDAHLAELMEAFSRSNLGPSRITLEVLDSGTFLSSPDAWGRLISLNERGFDLALDDIASTYSSLLRIQELPLQKVKLDRGFVRNLAAQPNGFRFLIAMAELARRLKMGFVAEGAETAEILDSLASLNLEYAQGFAISQPLAIGDLREWLPTYFLDPGTERPSTVLGLYALYVRDSFGYYQRLLSGTVPADAQGCPVTRHLIRLGLEGSDIGRAHVDYHDVLGRFVDEIETKPNPFLRNVEEARQHVEKLILDELARSLASER